jgi:hypothetical protein
MPTSSSEGKDIIRNWVNEFSDSINVVLDLGVGKGTYHKIFTKKKYGSILSNSSWIGVEAWTPYIEKYNLKNQYDLIINEDLRKINYDKIPKFDLVFAGDVLEHITKDEAIFIVDTISKIAKHIIISIPIVHYPQDCIEDNPYEIHVKDDWSHQEVLESFKNIKKHWQGSEIGVYYISL